MTHSWALAGRVVTPGETLEHGLVVITGTRIEWVGSAASYQGTAPVQDYGTHVIAPGFIDVHVHGGGGGSLRQPNESSIRQALAFHGRHGTTGCLATIGTAPLEQVGDTLHVLDRLMTERQEQSRMGAALLGVHLEGPWLNPTKAGGQRVEFMRHPSVAELEALPLAPVRWATVAPELAGAEALIRRMKELGLVVAAGHTAATYTEMQQAVAWGVDHCTHFFNAMSAFHQREPGVVGAGLDLTGLYLELIADGIHVHPGALRLAYASRGWERLLLITDAVEYAGEAEGVYEVDSRVLTVKDGSIRLQDGTLAGSSLTMNRAVALMVQQVGLPLTEAVAMATLIPARRLGLDDRTGSLVAGKDADLVVFDEDFQVWLTVIQGDVVFEQSG